MGRAGSAVRDDAVGRIYQVFRVQAAVLGYADIFLYAAIIAFMMIPLSFLVAPIRCPRSQLLITGAFGTEGIGGGMGDSTVAGSLDSLRAYARARIRPATTAHKLCQPASVHYRIGLCPAKLKI